MENMPCLHPHGLRAISVNTYKVSNLGTSSKPASPGSMNSTFPIHPPRLLDKLNVARVGHIDRRIERPGDPPDSAPETASGATRPASGARQGRIRG